MCTPLLKKMANFEQRANEEEANEWQRKQGKRGRKKISNDDCSVVVYHISHN